ncbi:unannotated protein [freshwater metagenome]|uniref:Unannotated protein n=1 Tax=freshwater metagenome TaxID=449393 RepID=A0A6J6WJN5_9ZZZZ
MSEYEAGDVNVVADEETNESNVDRAVYSASVLKYLATSMADEPEAVSVDIDDTPRGVKLSLHVGPDDMGRIIGRRGRTAQAIRTIVSAAGARDGVVTNVDIVD